MEFTYRQKKNAVWLETGAAFLGTMLFWTLYRLFLEPWLGQTLVPVGVVLAETAIKSVVFIVPAVYLVWRAGRELAFSFGEMFGWNQKNLIWGGALTLLFLVYYVVRDLITSGSVGLSFALSADDIVSTIVFAGLTEEIFFRGYLMNRLCARMRFWLANALSAFCFLLAHFPIWYANGHFQHLHVLSMCLTTFVIGMLLGYVAKRSGSVWGAVFAHSMHNLIVTVLV